ncbi:MULTISPECIES: arginine--tRNA ligase [unclassified Gemella]|uniref:arginine--tRNA ligase n=1 Tax=unclassified Gemella TaxID=2624949 RepID=UPI0015D01EC6|nr:MULTISPECIES: arginine--tRNA ligase [unclassified Gemella]MBF0710419.1 arginine--tRNA ligase [Gemella sp. GL1.1]NYS27763.1 arginine--tRNA ligase [Gemella sp. GL1]
MKNKIVRLLENSVAKITEKTIDIYVETPKNTENGDFSSNIAMQLTKVLKKNPRMIAEEIIANMEDNDFVKKIDIAGPGFINFFVNKSSLVEVLDKVLLEKDDFGQNNSGNSEKVLLEYVSANPTGDLHVGHARNGAVADSIVRIMKKSSYDVTREYYVNDAGNQINNLILSVDARYKQALGQDVAMPEDGYNGKDIMLLGKLLAEEFDANLLEKSEKDYMKFLREYSVNYQLNKLKKDLSDFRVEFDNFYRETWLYESGKITDTLAALKESGYVFEESEAVWLRTTSLGTGDDKDRVLIKADGSYTYFTPDIAYHKDKFDRGYDKLINLFGADHHGYVPRLKASVNASGYKSENLEVLIMQLVRLLEDGQEIKMSKRTGKLITIRDLIEEVGTDAARYFLAMRSADTHLDFDFALAKEQSSDNPLYYVQYAHARICSILRQAEDQGLEFTVYDKELLTDPYSVEILKNLAYFPELVAQAAKHREPHRVCNYMQTLAASFHKFYGNNKVISDNKEQTQSYLALITAVKITIKNALELVGVSAPERM